MNNFKEKLLDFIWIFYGPIKNIFYKRTPIKSFEDHTNKKYNVYLKHDNISYILRDILNLKNNATVAQLNFEPVSFESANKMINDFIEECKADHDLARLLDDIIFEIEEV